MLYFVLYALAITGGWRELRKRPWNEFKMANLAIRLQVRLRWGLSHGGDDLALYFLLCCDASISIWGPLADPCASCKREIL